MAAIFKIAAIFVSNYKQLTNYQTELGHRQIVFCQPKIPPSCRRQPVILLR